MTMTMGDLRSKTGHISFEAVLLQFLRPHPAILEMSRICEQIAKDKGIAGEMVEKLPDETVLSPEVEAMIPHLLELGETIRWKKSANRKQKKPKPKK